MAAVLKQRTQRRRGDAFAKGGHHAAGDKHETRHGKPVYLAESGRRKPLGINSAIWREISSSAPRGPEARPEAGAPPGGTRSQACRTAPDRMEPNRTGPNRQELIRKGSKSARVYPVSSG